MTVRSALLASGVTSPLAPAIVYTVPSGRLTIVKEICYNNYSGNIANVFLYVFNATPALVAIVQADLAMANGANPVHSRWFTLPAGWHLELQSSQANMTYYISGAELRD